MPLVGLAAGSLLGGAFFHMLPRRAINALGNDLGAVYLWLMPASLVFFALEQFLHWHHCHRASADCRKPLTYLDPPRRRPPQLPRRPRRRASSSSTSVSGITTWLAAAAHEVPQELGDFGVLIHGGWKRRSALLFNLLSALTFLLGALAGLPGAGRHIDVASWCPSPPGTSSTSAPRTSCPR
jgi:zinc and cadmium transporter